MTQVNPTQNISAVEPSANEPSTSVVHGFYDDAVVLITGGTGFIGKVLVEKLLRSFRIRRIYLLIRAKNARSVDERLAEFFEESVSEIVAASDSAVHTKR